MYDHESGRNGVLDKENSLNGTPMRTIICPPPEIADIIDRTAMFTARNGLHFEEKIRENEKRNLKFCFLNPGDPYHAYYEAKVRELKEGKLPEKDVEIIEQTKIVQIEPPAEETSVEEPPEFDFEVEVPSISARDMDVIKLTAQFTARCGGSFATTILKHEPHNHQFNFLHTNHSLYPFFNTLVNRYSKIITPSRTILDNLNKAINSKYDLLDSLMDRVRYEVYREKQHKKTEEEEDKERIAYASVNWHDFVVIGTVEFVEADEKLDLALPLNLEDLKVVPLAEKKSSFIFETEKNLSNEPEEDDIEIDEGSDGENMA